jgi:hypothetical protein
MPVLCKEAGPASLKYLLSRKLCAAGLTGFNW